MALPAVPWLTLAFKCKADVGPQTRSAVRTFVDPPCSRALQRPLGDPVWRPALGWPREVDRPGVWHRSGPLTAGRGFRPVVPGRE